MTALLEQNGNGNGVPVTTVRVLLDRRSGQLERDANRLLSGEEQLARDALSECVAILRDASRRIENPDLPVEDLLRSL